MVAGTRRCRRRGRRRRGERHEGTRRDGSRTSMAGQAALIRRRAAVVALDAGEGAARQDRRGVASEPLGDDRLVDVRKSVLTVRSPPGGRGRRVGTAELAARPPRTARAQHEHHAAGAVVGAARVVRADAAAELREDERQHLVLDAARRQVGLERRRARARGPRAGGPATRAGCRGCRSRPSRSSRGVCRGRPSSSVAAVCSCDERSEFGG